MKQFLPLWSKLSFDQMNIMRRLGQSLALATLLGAPWSVRAFPVANYYLPTHGFKYEHLQELARYDLLVLPADWQEWHKSELLELKRQNSKIKLFAYVPARGISRVWTSELFRDLTLRADEHHYLHDPQGQRISVWIGVQMMNLAGSWPEVLARFVAQKIIPETVWDGVFYDEIDERVASFNQGNIDTDNDGKRDHPGRADVAWRDGIVRLLKSTRERASRPFLVIINGSSWPEYQPWINGRLFEDFPTPWEGQGRWSDSMSSVQRIENQVTKPVSIIFNGTTKNTGHYNFAQAHFVATSALLAGVYPSYDFGTQDHGQRQWYDFYSSELGQPLTRAYSVTNPALLRIVNDDVWRRDFSDGTVLVNAMTIPRDITIDNHQRLTLAARDGAILPRPIGTIVGTPYINGAFVKFTDVRGQTIQAGSFFFRADLPAGARILERDLDADGQPELTIIQNGRLTIQDTKGKIIQTSDLSHPEITACPQSRGLTVVTSDIITRFLTNGSKRQLTLPSGTTNFRGLQVACGSFASVKEPTWVMTRIGGTSVRIITSQGRRIRDLRILPQKSTLRVTDLAVGDVGPEKGDELVVAVGGPKKPAEIYVFDSRFRLRQRFQPFGAKFYGAIQVGLMDANSDGRLDLAVQTTEFVQ